MGCGCLLAVGAVALPRFTIVVMWLFTDRMRDAMDSFLMGVLGFLLLPYTTAIYALVYSVGGGGVRGFGWFLVAMGFLMDLSTWFGGGRQARTRQVRAA